MSEKEIGTDNKGRKMVLTEDDCLAIVAPGGQRAIFSRKHIVRIITEQQAEVDKWKAYLAALDGALRYKQSNSAA